jgi:amidase
VKDAVYALDAIYGPDARNNYTSVQVGKTPTGCCAQFLTNKHALKGATFGLPWASFWALNTPAQNAQLTELLDLISSAGATIINGTELLDYQTVVSPDGWNWGTHHI